MAVALDFGEIVATGSADSKSILPRNGANFKVTGHPGKSVKVNFSDVTLKNNSWVSTNGGTNDQMTFATSVEHTGGSSTYSTGAVVTSGNSYGLVNSAGTGYLYLWVGGQLDISATQANGDYTGTLTMTVIY